MWPLVCPGLLVKACQCFLPSLCWSMASSLCPGLHGSGLAIVPSRPSIRGIDFQSGVGIIRNYEKIYDGWALRGHFFGQANLLLVPVGWMSNFRNHLHLTSNLFFEPCDGEDMLVNFQMSDACPGAQTCSLLRSCWEY